MGINTQQTREKCLFCIQLKLTCLSTKGRRIIIELYTMGNKIHLAVIFGGRSAEHDISLRSAKNVIRSINKEKYDLSFIGITREGQWIGFDTDQKLAEIEATDTLTLDNKTGNLSLDLAATGAFINNTTSEKIQPQVVFPVLHGPYGEDGTVQGLLQLANIAFVGPNVLGSSVGMDKDIMKRLLRDAGLPVNKFITLYKGEPLPPFEEVEQQLGMPCFIKPANLGSSVGISKARNAEELQKAIDIAFRFDTKILVEEFIDGREVECAILGNRDAKGSIPGEIISHADFYSFDAKYIDQQASETKIPADFSSDEKREELRQMAVDTFKLLGCEGLSRVDIFVTPEEKFYVNEINTIPGFTSISMYPMLWKATGIAYDELIDQLVSLAIQRHNDRMALQSEV